ncbi:hypothetical protein ACNKHK_18460 [Shigella flexneri]
MNTAMWTLAGAAGRVPEAGEDLELKIGERTGVVPVRSAAVKLADGQVLVQVVMNNDVKSRQRVPRSLDDAKTLQNRTAAVIRWKSKIIMPDCSGLIRHAGFCFCRPDKALASIRRQ